MATMTSEFAAEEKAKAFKRNPICAVCHERIEDVSHAAYLPTVKGLAHTGERGCATDALKRLFQRATRVRLPAMGGAR